MTNKILIAPICTSELELPLPKRLTKKNILKTASILNEDCFPSKMGKQQFREFQKSGFLIMSWPDGTRCAFKHFRNLTISEGVEMYSVARNTLENFAKDFLTQKAYSC